MVLLLYNVFQYRFVANSFSQIVDKSWPRFFRFGYESRTNRFGDVYNFPTFKEVCQNAPIPCSPFSLYDVEFKKQGNRSLFVRHWMGRRKEWGQWERRLEEEEKGNLPPISY